MSSSSSHLPSSHTTANSTTTIYDPFVLSKCAGCNAPFVSLDVVSATSSASQLQQQQRAVMITSRCPISSTDHVSVMHEHCHEQRQKRTDAMVATPVENNIPMQWTSRFRHRQGSAIVEQYRQLRQRWTYSSAGQTMARFDSYEGAQGLFNIDQVGASQQDDDATELPFEPFVLTVPLLMSSGGAITSDRPQLWISPLTLPYAEFKMLMTFALRFEVVASAERIVAFADNMASVRKRVVMPYTIQGQHQVDGRYWMQEGYDRRIFILGLISQSETVLEQLYEKLINNPSPQPQSQLPAGLVQSSSSSSSSSSSPHRVPMAWYFWKSRIQSFINISRDVCVDAFSRAAAAIRESIYECTNVSLLDMAIDNVPVSTIDIRLSDGVPYVEYRANATSQASFWVFPTLSESETTAPIAYTIDANKINNDDLYRKWLSVGSLPLVYNTDKFRAVYERFPFVPLNRANALSLPIKITFVRNKLA